VFETALDEHVHKRLADDKPYPALPELGYLRVLVKPRGLSGTPVVGSTYAQSVAI
jgi:hypothetical protein